MNSSRLVKALAVIGLMSFASHSFGAFTQIEGDDFEGYDIGAFTNQLDGTSWTADEGDISEIVSVEVSEITAFLPAYDGYGAATDTQVLKLNTEGNDLKFAAETEENAIVRIETLIKMVGSESEQAIAANDPVQTAVYLDISDTNNPVLKGYVTDSGSNTWVELSGVAVADGDWIQLAVEIDYTTKAAQNMAMVSFEVNGVVLEDVNSESSFISANNAATFSKRYIEEVAFRGTGMIDNFKVSEEESEAGSVFLTTRIVDIEGVVLEVEFEDDEILFGQGYQDIAWGTYGVDPVLELKRVRIKNSEGETLFILLADGMESIFQFQIPGDHFENGKTYFIDKIYGPEGQDEELDPDPDPQGGDVEFTIVGDNNANLTFTEMSLDGDIATVKFTADGVVNQTPATLWLLGTTDVTDGTPFSLEIEVDVVADEGALEGSFEIDMSEIELPDGAFLTGLSTTDPEVQVMSK